MNEILQNLQIGASFNPEHWVFENNHDVAKHAFDILTNEFKIKEIRLAIRSSDVVEEDYSLNFWAYDYFISQAIERNAIICLNVGPVKTMRWPEQTISHRLLAKLSTPQPPRSVIRLDSEIATVSLEYLRNLLEIIKKQFGDTFAILQANNEPFNPFGVFEWEMSVEFEKKCIETIWEFFPGRKILLNSNGRRDLKNIMKLISQFESTMQHLFIIGINYYYKSPDHRYIPILRNLDNVTLSPLCSTSLPQLRKFKLGKNIAVEISELQFEPWMGLYESPGNSYAEFVKTLNRSRDIFAKTAQENGVVRLWGIEQLLVKMIKGELTEEHRKMIEALKREVK